MAFFGSAPKIFNLQAFVNIVTKQADTQLAGLEKKAEESGGKMERAFGRASAMIIRMAGPAVLGALGAAISTVVAATVKMGFELHDALSVFERDLDVTREQARELGKDLTALWQVNTDDTQSLTAGLVAVRQQFGDLGDQTQAVSQTLLDYVKVTKGDFAEATKLSRNVLKQYNLELKDLPQVLNTVKVVQEETGASTDRLLQALAATAPVTKSLGLSLQEAAAFMGLLERSGAGAEAANESLVMFLNATTAATDKQKQAFKTLGIELDAAGRPVKGVDGAFRDLIGQMEKGAITGDKLTAALSIVGTEAGKKLIGALKGSEGAFDALGKKATESLGNINRASQAVDRTVRERLVLAFREAFGETITENSEAVVQFLEYILDFLGQLTRDLQDFGSFLGAIFFEFEGDLKALIDIFTEVKDGVVNVWESLEREFLLITQRLVNKILELFSKLPTILREQLGETETFLQEFSTALGQEAEQKPKFEDAFVSVFEPFAYIEGTELGKRNAEGNFITRGQNRYAEQVAARETERARDAKPSALPQTSTDPIKGSGGDYSASAAAAAAAARAKQAEKEKKEQQELLKLKAEGLRIDIDAAKNIQTKLRLQEQLVRLEGDLAKSAATTDEQRVQIEKNTLAEIFALRQEAAAERLKKAEEISKAEKELQISALEAADKDREAALAKLDEEKKAKEKLGLDKVAIDEWYSAQRDRIEKDAAKKTAENEKKALEEKQKAAKALSDLQVDTFRAQAEAETNETKKAALVAKADNLEKLQSYREQIEAAREAGVEEVEIQKFIAAEKKRIEQGEKAAKNQEHSADPRKSAEDAFAGLQEGLSFSIGGGSGTFGEPAATKAARKELSRGLSELGKTSKEPKEREDKVTIVIEDSSGKVLSQKTVAKDSEDAKMVQKYQLGRF